MNAVEERAAERSRQAMAADEGPATPDEAPEAPPEAEDDEETPEEMPAPRFAAGDRVSYAGGSGEIVGDGEMDYCYEIAPDDGGPNYLCPERGMEPYTEPEEGEEMSMDSTAPAALSAELGLAPEATIADCVTAVQGLNKDLATERASALSTALDAANVKGDLRAMVAADITVNYPRGESESYSDVVARHKAKSPSAYHQQASQPVAPESSEQPKGAAKLPVHNPLPGASKPAPAKVSAAERQAGYAARAKRRAIN